MKIKNASKFLSLILRHKPEIIGVSLDNEGWVDISILLKALKKHSNIWSRDKLEHVVKNNDKKRFYIDRELDRIRASQGHSIDVKIKYKELVPPKCLYHGTTNKSLDNIYKEGLCKMNRHHVHLSDNTDTAIKVGARKGKPIVLVVNTDQMHKDGYKFYISDNGVWLTDYIPSIYILNLLSQN